MTFCVWGALAVAACAAGDLSNGDLALFTDGGTTVGPDGAVPNQDAAGTQTDGGPVGPPTHFDAAPSEDAGTDDAGQAEASTPESGPDDSGGTSTCAAHGYSGTLATFDLSSQSGSETTAPATSSATGVTASALSRAAALTATSGSGSINSSNWPTAASADATRYYSFSVTPASGCALSLSTLAIGTHASSTGPANGDVATSGDAFGTHFGTFSGTATTNVSFSAVGGSSAIEIRVYGYGASSTAGTWRIENTMTLSGSIQ